jgi:hypothetical protein
MAPVRRFPGVAAPLAARTCSFQAPVLAEAVVRTFMSDAPRLGVSSAGPTTRVEQAAWELAPNRIETRRPEAARNRER